MSKHTPGPWLVTGGTFVYALNGYGTNSFWANIYGGSQGGYKSPGTPGEEIEANANLMSAAPDLLEALETLKDSFIVAVGDKSPYAKCALERPLLAIAKARGES